MRIFVSMDNNNNIYSDIIMITSYGDMYNSINDIIKTIIRLKQQIAKCMKSPIRNTIDYEEDV